MQIFRSRFPRGAKPSPRHKLLAAIPHRVVSAPPPQFALVPAKLDMWGNDQYGDCHGADADVLTDRGWVPWTEYDGVSPLGTVNPNTLLLEFQSPRRVVRREYDGPMAFGTHKGQDFALTPNHRFLLRPYRIVKDGREYVPGASGYGAFEFRKVRDVPSRFMIPGAPSGCLGTRIDKLTVGHRQWDGTDFLRLLSLIISDGYAGSGETNQRLSGFCCFREDRLDMVRSFAYKLGIREEASRPGVWVISDAALADWLRINIYEGEIHRSPFKKIPGLVKVAGQDQIEEFLRFYGDQSFSNGRDFYTSSPFLADGLQELLLRTGKRANIGERLPRIGGINEDGKRIESKHPSFQLHVWEDSDIAMLGPKCKKSSMAFENYKGEVFCATVPNSTLITRRNGSVLVSGNCVSAEEAFAKACYFPEIFIDAQTVEKWASRHGVLNGADLAEVMDAMQHDGFQVGSQVYDDGPYTGVDYSQEPVLQSALAQGPVKIAIDANALPQGAGNQQGWYATGGGRYPNTDHCVALCGYGPAQWLYGQLKVPLPSGLAPATAGYLLFTWSTIGFVDHAWIMGTCVEAWLRNPTTIGVPPLPGPSPIPPPVPPVPPAGNVVMIGTTLPLGTYPVGPGFLTLPSVLLPGNYPLIPPAPVPPNPPAPPVPTPPEIQVAVDAEIDRHKAAIDAILISKGR